MQLKCTPQAQHYWREVHNPVWTKEDMGFPKKCKYKTGPVVPIRDYPRSAKYMLNTSIQPLQDNKNEMDVVQIIPDHMEEASTQIGLWSYQDQNSLCIFSATYVVTDDL